MAAFHAAWNPARRSSRVSCAETHAGTSVASKITRVIIVSARSAAFTGWIRCGIAVVNSDAHGNRAMIGMPHLQYLGIENPDRA